MSTTPQEAEEMSSATTVDVDEDRLVALERRVEQLEAENTRKDERINELEDTVSQLQAERENEATVEFRTNESDPNLGSLFIGEHPVGTKINGLDRNVDANESNIEDVRQDLINEQKTRSRADSEIEQRISTVADEVGIDDLDTDLAGDDKLVRLAKNGTDAVIGGRVYPVHKRSRKLLLNASAWGKQVSDANGPRVRFVAPEVKPFLDAEFNRDFKTSEIERIFEKVEDLGEDSPRQVRKDKTKDGSHRLTVRLVDGSLVEEAE